MSSDIAGEANDATPVAPESPQPLQLTTSNSSRCTSPLSPPSDQNASASSVDEEVTSLNLTVCKMDTPKGNTVKRTPSLSNLLNNNCDPTDLSSHGRKNKIDQQDVPSRLKTKSSITPSSSHILDNNVPQSPDIMQLLLEYRHVLLDVLSKSILYTDNDSSGEASHKGVVLPLKCQCGLNSKICNQVTRSSTYVHQLELRFHTLMESTKSAPEIKYTPKRPWYISPALPYLPSLSFVQGKTSLLDKKKMTSRLPGAEKPVSIFSGNSSINSSVNGDEDDVDSDEDDVNDDNLSENLHSNFGNGSVEEMNGGGKTILEGYLESMKNVPSEEGSDDDDKDQVDDEDDDIDANGDDDPNRGPGKRIDMKTKKLVINMLRNSTSYTNISRQIGISRKSVRRIISNYRAYGLLEKKRESRIQKGMQDLILKLYSQGRSYTQISRATTVSKPTISKIIKQYVDSNIYTKGPTNGVAKNGTPLPVPDLFPDSIDDEMDEEKEMVVDEDAIDEEDEQELDEEEDINENLPTKHKEINATILASYSSYPKAQMKSKKNMSLIQGPYNGYSQHGKPSNLSNVNRLSLIKPPDRYKPYDKVRHSSPADFPNMPQHRNKSNSIVPPLPSNYSLPRKMNNNSHMNDRDNVRMKSGKLSRHSGELSIKESLIVPEADKNNNTTMANCNVTITSTSGGNHNTSNSNPVESASLLPPIPASLIEGNSDSEANLVPKNFIEGFPAGIMNSLNPNRATKLTLEDFNIVWQLRSQHWTHNQIRKYFQQRGKSISKSSISRIMNGKQRNFQQFFNVVPSSF